MKMLFSIPLSILAVALACTSSALAVPLVLDGSFESPVLPPSGSISGGGDNWTPGFNGGAFSVQVASNGTGEGTTAFGNQFLTLNPGATDLQSISSFNIGTTYTVTAYFADLFRGVSPALMMSVTGLAGLTTSSTTATSVNGFYAPGAIPFTVASLTFIATATTETLTLTDMSTNGTIAVDNVAFAVPEPSSYAALAFGMGALGVTVARLRARRSA